MTYVSEVTADAPKLYYRLEDTVLGTTTPNIGSTGGSGTVSGAITAGQPGVPGVGGSSWKFDGAATVSQSVNTGTALTTAELWYKRDTTSAVTANLALMGMTGNSRSWDFRITDVATGTLSVFYQTSTYANVSVPAVVDGNWHHLAMTYDGAHIAVYVDGASVWRDVATFGANTSGTVYVGPRPGSTATTVGGWIDEPAFYIANIGAARILAHYNAGVIPTGVSTNVNAPVSTASAAMAAPIVQQGVTIAVPASTASASAPAPVVTAVDTVHQIFVATADKNTEVGGGTATTIVVGSGGSGGFASMFKFPTPTVSTGSVISNATLSLSNSNAGTAQCDIRIATSDWTEANTATPTYSSTSYGSVTLAANATTAIDVTAVTQAWADGALNYGIVLLSTGYSVIATRENATVANRPTLRVTTGPKPVLAITVTPMTASAAAVEPVAYTSTNKVISIGAGTASASMVTPVVSFTRNVGIQVGTMTATAIMPNPVSKVPDQIISVDPIEAYARLSAPTQYIGYDVNINVSAMSAGVESEPALVDTKTDRNVRVINAATATAKMVGIYNADLDRYLTMVPRTTNSTQDTWLKMDELSGTTANDSLFGDDPLFKVNGTYFGSPAFATDGPQLRKAVHFDGVDDYVSMMNQPYRWAYATMDATIEFSIRTTQQNGVLMTGNALAYNPQSSTGGNVAEFFGYSDAEIRLSNGQIVLFSGSGNNESYRVRKNIADGEWHHIVISVPSATGAMGDAFHLSSTPPSFVAIDGQVEWSRYSVLQGRAMLPSSIMARVVNGVPSQFVAGDMRDFVVRMNYAVSANTAQQLYYEWSNTLVIRPTPMAASATAVNPHSARGNVKKMIALYGLPLWVEEGREYTYPGTRDGYFNYFSVYGGYGIPNGAGATNTNTGTINQGAGYFSNLTKMQYVGVRPFMMDDWLVYPVAIMHQPGGNGGPFSAPGMENGEFVDRYLNAYVNDKTGLPRFIDLDTDLIDDVTNFDAITAVNYPADQPVDGEGHVFSDPLVEPRQHNMGLTDAEWRQARDDLRDSILNASYRGVNLFINEPQMAEHLGFISGWDKHITGSRVEFMGAGGVDATGYTNKHAEQINAQHLHLLSGSVPEVARKGVGQFHFVWQANAKRKIINTEPGLTDIPTYDIVEEIHYDKDNSFDIYAQVDAYDVAHRPNGLSVGDEMIMAMAMKGDYNELDLPFQPWSVGSPRQFIVSAKPNGIAGKPISKEMDFYYGVNGAKITNPWKDNVYTIAAERGTVVRGRPIGGRAFIEFMSPEQTGYIAVHSDKSWWHGTPGLNVSDWDYDSRRTYEFTFVTTFNTHYAMTTSTENSKQIWALDKQDITLVSTGDGPPVHGVLHVSMNTRGLNWLSEIEELQAGDAKVYVGAMNASANMAAATSTHDRNVTINVIGAARADAEMRRPRNFAGNDVVERVLPMVADAKMNGLGREIKVAPAEVTASMPDVQVNTGGDRIYVYMDADRNVTLFMKED